MALSKIYPSEPGVRVDRIDSGILSPSQQPTTDTLLIIGVAVDGPNDRPTWWTDINQLQREYGPTDRRPELNHPARSRGFNGNTISRAAQEAWDAGCRSIIVRRVGGSKAATYLAGYNYSLNNSVVANLTGPMDLPTGGFPYDNSTISTVANTITTISGAQIRYTAGTGVTGDLVGWSVYVPTKSWSGRIAAIDSTTITLSDAVPSYIAGEPFYIYPLGSYAVFDSMGQEFNPANFTVSPGTATEPATLKVIATPFTEDTRYLRDTPTEGETLYVNYLMKTDRVLNLYSLTASNIYNATGTFGTDTQDGCWVTIQDNVMQIFVPKYRNSPTVATTRIPVPAIEIDLTSVSSLGELADKINKSQFNTSVLAEIATDATWNGQAVVVNPQTGGFNVTAMFGGNTAALDDVAVADVAARFTGGSTGVEMGQEALYNILHGVGEQVGVLDSLLENCPASYRHIAGVYADDVVNGKEGAWVELLTHHCWTASRLGYGCQGVIGLRPLPQNKIQASEVEARVAKAVSIQEGVGAMLYTGLFGINDTSGEPVDIGQYINITAGPDGYTRDPNLGAIYSNQSAVYAGLLASMNIDRSTTAFPLRGSLGLAYSYSREQLNRLIIGVGIDDAHRGGAYTPFRLDNLGRGITVHSGETAAKRNSQFTKESTVKIVQSAEVALAAAARPYLGKRNSLEVHQALQFACEQVLDSFYSLGALAGGKGIGYSVSLSTTKEDRDIGKVRMDVALKTAVELRTIYIPITVGT